MRATGYVGYGIGYGTGYDRITPNERGILMIDIEQPTCEKLTVDWGLSPQDNFCINELFDEIRNAEQRGERFNPAMVQDGVAPIKPDTF